MNALKLVALLTGLVIAGEALALLIGMHFLSGRDNSWISFKNDLLIGLDLVTGIALTGLALSDAGFSGPFAWIMLGLTILAHGYRDWEYLAHSASPFCVNLPLFTVNNLKLLGLIAIIPLVSF